MLSASSSDRQRGGSARRDAQTGAQAHSRSVRILIVEDEWLVSTEMESTLEDAGYEVLGVAISASEALLMADRFQPDLVLMDIRLSGARDGVETALELYREFGLRCLFVSAHSDAGTRERGAAAHPVGWLMKPFSGGQLLSAVATAVRDMDSEGSID